jgi:predicted transglutaminase-like cysteine proteinase
LKLETWRAPFGARAGAVRLLTSAACALATASIFGDQAQAGVYTSWVMPPIAISEAERPAAPNVFGTVALPVRARPTGTRWTKLMGASLNQPALKRLAEQARGRSPLQQAAYVQVAVDRSIRTRNNSLDCSDDGYWAAAGETLTRGMGDCFDVAIAKMEALRSLGFSYKDLYLTTGYFQSPTGLHRRRGMAALLVRIDSGFLLLPDGTSPVIEASSEDNGFSAYQPYITYGYGMTWVHGRIVRRGSPAMDGSQGEALASLSR